ncbi:CARDB domain-containing protein, partial [Limnospira sp. PMC 1298.21]|uniref:CARDB domain-containing protein n=1 Tax=Limnospira sp. PMC 1298.21 TaxID=2981081 RepID=UPI0028E0F73D
ETNATRVQGETDLSNNAAASAALTVSAPDLEVVGINAPATAAVRQSIAVEYTVTNRGPGIALNNWTDRIYLSDDANWDSGDTLLAWVSISAQT